ncbi:MAG: DNA polymerase Y family protein [Granulosicoccus sp.]
MHHRVLNGPYLPPDSDMLWLALYFPQLPIDRQQESATEQPRAVVLQEGARRRIMACNGCAAAAGVKPGLALKNAYALAPSLIVSEYDEDEQRRHLEQLSLSALQYSSIVSPEAPDTILLEIAASLKLFGGLNTLHDRIREDMQQQQLTLHTGIAPTPAAASLFARAGIRQAVVTSEALTDTLNRIQLSCLPLDVFTSKGLRQSGIHTLGEMRQLSPAALTRRFGNECTTLLYKLDGRLPDPRTPFKTQASFSQAINLPLEAPDTQALTFPLKRLLGSLGGFLRARDLGVAHLKIVLHHHRHKPQTVSLKFLEATTDMTHLLRIATERLESTTLQDAVIKLTLDSDEFGPTPVQNRDLFQKAHTRKATVEQLLDKLVARLGKDAVYTASSGDDHRPEKAWTQTLLNGRQTATPWPARPLWLLPEPKLLNQPVTVHTPPERIENGWWDELDVRRDYFIASNRQGSYFWLYRLRHQPDQWWIHGLFA